MSLAHRSPGRGPAGSLKSLGHKEGEDKRLTGVEVAVELHDVGVVALGDDLHFPLEKTKVLLLAVDVDDLDGYKLIGLFALARG